MLVLTPDHAHAELAVRTLEAGLAVVRREAARDRASTMPTRILAAARRTGTRLYVGHNMRHMPVVRLMREAHRGGRDRRGQGGLVPALRRQRRRLLLQGLARRPPQHDRPAAAEGGHDIDVIHWLAGAYTAPRRGDGRPRRLRRHRRPPRPHRPSGWPTGSPTTTGRRTAQTGLNPVVDVEDISMMMMRARQRRARLLRAVPLHARLLAQLHRHRHRGSARELRRRPGRRSSRCGTRRTDSYRDDADEVIEIPAADTTGHGGADPLLIAEFLRFAREGGPTETSPVAAREAVAAGVCATTSLRTGGGAVDVPRLDPVLVDWFDRGQA